MLKANPCDQRIRFLMCKIRQAVQAVILNFIGQEYACPGTDLGVIIGRHFGSSKLNAVTLMNLNRFQTIHCIICITDITPTKVSKIPPPSAPISPGSCNITPTKVFKILLQYHFDNSPSKNQIESYNCNP